MVPVGDIDPELRGTDRLFAMMALMDERLVKMGADSAERLDRVEGSIDELRESVAENHADASKRLTGLELREARRDGAVRVLLWAIPGGPTLVGLVAAIALYAVARG